LKPGFFANLAWRVGTATVVLPLLVWALFGGPVWVLELIVAVAVLLGLNEFYALLAARSIRPFKIAGLAITSLCFLEAAWPALRHPPLWPLGMVLLLSALLVRGGAFAESVPAAAATLLGAAYLGTLGGSMAALRSIAPASSGPWRLVLLFATVMVADTFAYFVGSAIGRHKLAPRISPGKTIEGGVGAIVGGVLTAVLVQRIGWSDLPVVHAAVLGALIAVVGTVGDLAESLFKRWAGVKDSGALFPGHGGMLDRLDSLLFGAPVLYYYLLWR